MVLIIFFLLWLAIMFFFLFQSIWEMFLGDGIINILIKNYKFNKFVENQVLTYLKSYTTKCWTDIPEFYFIFFYGPLYIKYLEEVEIPRCERIGHYEWQAEANETLNKMEIFVKDGEMRFIEKIFK